MTPAAEAWLFTLAALGAMVGLYYHAQRHHRHRWVQTRSERHDILILALEDWIAQEDIRKALYRAGVTKPGYLAEFRERMGALSEPKLREAVAALLKDRSVRMQVAKHMERKGLKKADVMRKLKSWR